MKNLQKTKTTFSCIFRNTLGENSSDQSAEFRISLMLVVVAATFIILRFPEIITVQIVMYYRTINSPLTEQAYIVLQITNLLVVLNHSVNFIIYMIFFNSFRETFARCFMLKCNVQRENGTKVRTVSENAPKLITSETGVSSTSDK